MDGVPIDTMFVRRLLTTRFPQWADLPLAPVQQCGMDNAAFRLGDGPWLTAPPLP